MALQEMTLDECLQFVRGTDGRPFRIEFQKRTTGEMRVMNASTRAPEHAVKALSGKGMTFDPNSRGLMVVWDCDKEAWRMISTEGISRVHTASGWVMVLGDQVHP